MASFSSLSKINNFLFRPIIAPTNAFTTINKRNWLVLGFRLSLIEESLLVLILSSESVFLLTILLTIGYCILFHELLSTFHPSLKSTFYVNDIKTQFAQFFCCNISSIT